MICVNFHSWLLRGLPSLVFSFESASENSADRWLLFIASWECLVLNRLRIKYSSVTGKNIKNILFAHKHTPIHTHNVGFSSHTHFLPHSFPPSWWGICCRGVAFLFVYVAVKSLVRKIWTATRIKKAVQQGQLMLHVSVQEEHNGVMHMRALHLHDLLKMISLLVFLSSASQNLLVKFVQLVKCNIFPVNFPFIFYFF